MADEGSGASGGVSVSPSVLRKSAGHCREISLAVQGGAKRPEVVSDQTGGRFKQQHFELGVALQVAATSWARQTVSVLNAIDLTARNLDESAKGHSSVDNGLAQQMQSLGSLYH